MSATVPTPGGGAVGRRGPDLDRLFEEVRLALRAAWRHRWLGLGVAWGIAVIGGIAVLKVPERYEASARVYVDTQSVLKPLMSGLTVQPDIDQQVAMLARTLITRPNVETLLQKAGIEPLGDTERKRDLYIDELVRNIKVTGGGRGNLYNLTYRDPDPQRARLLIEGLVTFFVESGLGNKKRDTDDARKFIDEQIASYEAKLSEAENRVKDFKIRNFGFTGGTSGQDYFGRIASVTEEIAKMRSDLRAAEQGRDALRRELSGESPLLVSDAGPGPSVSPELDARLDAQRRQLDELMRRYTEDHPDVVQSKRIIVELEAQRRRDLERARAEAAQGGNRVSSSNNPVYQRIKIGLADAESNVASLRSKLGDAQARYDQLKAIAGRAPQVEAEMAQLNRDYEILRKNYEALVARRESAVISGNVDASAQLTEFRVIEPPRVGPGPVFPQRGILIMGLLGAAFLGGVAAAFAMTQLYPTVQNARQLRSLVPGRPILGTVSAQPLAGSGALTRGASLRFTGAVLALPIVLAAWAVWVLLNARI